MVYVRTEGEAVARAHEPRDLAADGGSVAVGATTRVAVRADAPFRPLAVALEEDSALRTQFAEALNPPSMTAWNRLRWALLALAAAPILMLLELDRELVAKDLLGPGRLLVDLLTAAYVAFELTRRVPRVTAVAGVAMLAFAMRWSLVAARLCGKAVHPAVWGCAVASLGTGFAILAYAPSRSRIALELLGKLGISRSDANAARTDEPPAQTLVYGAIAAAIGLPALLFFLRRGEVPLVAQGALFVAYGAFVPLAVRKIADATRPDARVDVARTLLAIVTGLTVTAALLYGTRQFLESGSELARCTARLDEATKKVMAAEAAELARRIAGVRASTWLALMTTAVMPLAEERIYRGLLQDVLVRKYGPLYGVFASAVVFALAHVGVYEVALYQTVLLGISFGIAYLEGGIIAAFVVHALWNLLNVA